MNKYRIAKYTALIVLLTFIQNGAIAEELQGTPTEISPHDISGIDSVFPSWSHATGTINGVKSYVVSIPSKSGCSSALYELTNDMYSLIAITDKYDCGETVNFEIKDNLIETRISKIGSSSIYYVTYKFSKRNNQFILIGVEQRAEYGNAEKYYKHGLSLNTLNSKATEWHMKYCLGDYKVPCKSSKSSEIVKLNKINKFSGFNYEHLENEISSKLKLPPLW